MAYDSEVFWRKRVRHAETNGARPSDKEPRLFLLLPRVESLRSLFRIHPRLHGSLPVRWLQDIKECREMVPQACLFPTYEKEVPRLRRRLRQQGDSLADKCD